MALFTADAQGAVVERLAGIESPTTSPYDLDQVSTNCSGSSAGRDTSKAYAGVASLKVHIEATECSPYARGIFNSNAPNHVVEGDDLWFGVAIFLPSGFFSAHTKYTDLMRMDSYVSDGGSLNKSSEQQSINFASFSNDDIYVQAESNEAAKTLVGPLSPSVLAENSWHWVEIHARLDKDAGEAFTQLKIDGVSRGTSTGANIFAGRADFNRFRYGLVSAGSSGSGNLTLYIDRASVSTTERGP
jgi:polysaccharide lyase-like protein